MSTNVVVKIANFSKIKDININTYLRIVQLIVFILGSSIIYHLIFNPTLGTHLMWDVLIPIAPALLVVATGLWRNICPLALVALFPRHIDRSKKIKLTALQIDKLNLIGILILFSVIPLRHAIFNTDGLATALLLLSLASIAFIGGLFFDWKSAWCSGLCPIYPVERLYGQNTKMTLPNAHCTQCSNCVTPCPDSTSITYKYSTKNVYKKISGLLLIGAFPGFIYGWFQVPDYYHMPNISELITIYQIPMLWSLATMSLFLLLKEFIKIETLVSIFAASSVSCYYWFRIPALFGFGIFPEDGMIMNLTHIVPSWFMIVITFSTTLFFFWWIVFSKQDKKSWMIRPAFVKNKK